MFENLQALPEDPILGLMAAFRADPAPVKIDLGVGVYKDEHGKTPVLAAVRAAEAAVLAEQQTKTYLGPAGNEQFNALMSQLILGDKHTALTSGRVRALQAPGGCGALRLGAELLTTTGSRPTIHVSDPTWANHVPLLSGAGLKLERYPYFDTRSGTVRFDAMLERLNTLPAGDVVLLHGCCHNPTGADLSLAQWRQIADVLLQRRLIPYVDLAYQGLGEGITEDSEGTRLIAATVPEALIAVSCSKNFGLYRERVGLLMVLAGNETQAVASASHLRKIARGIYSMPPDHGAAIVARILSDAKLSNDWRNEVNAMRERMMTLRRALSKALAATCTAEMAAAVDQQRGMFSTLAVTPEAADTLREKHHIYMTRDGRINIAGISLESVDYIARAIGSVVGR
ncbi:aromatic amino acid transaminase [Steroidobacter sp.]|uniref:amino acid aminotransferase n=1 Tax=Steroidobacter sp. TaxID=1978227 RepID=UPI001A472564|nr:amino acid aminotransferase [Steroidobacter sp.]MBL8265838.1 aspartate/tyrosine/aromatic aminotransferase [Steroidobacter sp.]